MLLTQWLCAGVVEQQGARQGAREVSVGDVERIEVELVSRLALPVLLREVALQLGVLQEMRVIVSPRKPSEQPARDSQVAPACQKCPPSKGCSTFASRVPQTMPGKCWSTGLQFAAREATC